MIRHIFSEAFNALSHYKLRSALTMLSVTWGIASLVLLLGALYVAHVMRAPPPSTAPVAWFGVAASVVFTAWAWWIDRHRGPAKPL